MRSGRSGGVEMVALAAEGIAFQKSALPAGTGFPEYERSWLVAPAISEDRLNR